jgi:hypothetical protein
MPDKNISTPPNVIQYNNISGGTIRDNFKSMNPLKKNVSSDQISDKLENRTGKTELLRSGLNSIKTGINDAKNLVTLGMDSYRDDLNAYSKCYSLAKSVYAMKELHGLMILLTTYIVDNYLFGQDYLYTPPNISKDQFSNVESYNAAADLKILGISYDNKQTATPEIKYITGKNQIDFVQMGISADFPIHLHNTSGTSNIVNTDFNDQLTKYTKYFNSLETIRNNTKQFEEDILVKLSNAKLSAPSATKEGEFLIGKENDLIRDISKTLHLFTFQTPIFI